jgi:hypothetical protein
MKHGDTCCTAVDFSLLLSRWTCSHCEVAALPSDASRLRLKRDGTRTNQIWSFGETTSPFKSAWASVQSTAGSRGVRISGSNAGYTMS